MSIRRMEEIHSNVWANVESDLSNEDENNSQEYEPHESVEIPNNLMFKVDEKFVITVIKENNIDREAKRNCKILKISSDYNFDEALRILEELKHDEYPSLFIFIVEIKNIRYYRAKRKQNGNKKLKLNKSKKVRKIKEMLFKFCASRPLVLQLTSVDENVTKFYYKEESSNRIQSVDLQKRKIQKLQKKSTFLYLYLTEKIEDFEVKITKNLSQDEISLLILRFLSALRLSEYFFDDLVLKCAESGSKSKLLAAIDAPFIGDGRVLNVKAQKYLSRIINESTAEQSQNLKKNQSVDEEPSISSSGANQDSSGESDEEETSSKTSSTHSDSHLYSSVLYSAVKNSNTEVIDYLVCHCTHLIQQLPLKHQIRISTTAFQSSQFEVLCDLLEFSDFPFPENFDVFSTNNERLFNIAKKRMQFESYIKADNHAEITKFIESNLSLRIVYNPENKSALKQAIDSKKYKIYFSLKSLGFTSAEFDNHKEILSGKDLKKADKIAAQQRSVNVNNSLSDSNNPVMALSTRSFIHNRKISKQQETEYRMKIKKWYEDIKKIEFGSELLEVAASCENLKIIFDYDSSSVNNVSFEGSNVLGSTFPISKWIFIGSKLSDERREQQIKGILAHELCHYVMRLVYENKEHPYYKHRAEIATMFETIVKTIDKWSSEKSGNPDDECNGIISSVFKYPKSDFHPELIVRVVQILAEFDDDEEKSKYLQDKYKVLFEFFRDHVFTELKKFNLKIRENVRKINRVVELLPIILDQEIEFSSSKNIKALLDDKKVVIATTNVPKLLLINICNYLRGEYGDLFDTQNIFIFQENLSNNEICMDLQKLVTINHGLNIFINCSNENFENLEKLILNESSKFVLIMSSKSHYVNFLDSIAENVLSLTKMEMNYNIKDLTIETQQLLLQVKINFQNNSDLSFHDLLKNEIESDAADVPIEQEKKILEDFIELVDDRILNFLINNSKISVNTKFENDLDKRQFEYLFQRRQFIEKQFKTDNKNKNLEEQKLDLNGQHDKDIPQLLSVNEHYKASTSHEEYLDNNLLTKNSELEIDESFYEPKINEESQEEDEESQEEDEESEGEMISDDRSFYTNFYTNENFSDSEISSEDAHDEMLFSHNEQIFKSQKAICQHKLSLHVKNQKYVLISDKAGTGKSWVMKKFTNILSEMNPTRWVTYVDLKQFIKEFEAFKIEPEFLCFMSEKMLKPCTEFEVRLFKKLYTKGKVFVLFDGFDEIAPDCAEFVSKLAKSFESNGGNQLWIATRDYFEVDLKEKLEIETVYKLDEFTNKDGIDFITKTWLLRDLKDGDGIKSKDDFKKYVENSPKFKTYQETVARITRKISIHKSRSIGLPQIFRMIADTFKDDKSRGLNFQEFKFYEKFAEGHYERWATAKGEIRKIANIRSQKLMLNFWKFHQFVAVKSLFPDFHELRDLENGAKEWPDEEIIACGLISKSYGSFYFLHKTFCEFFAADFISKELKKSCPSNEVLKIFVRVLTIKKFEVIRMFLNDAIEESTIMENIEGRIQKFIEHFYSMETFAEIFRKQLENLADFVIIILKNGNRERFKSILHGRLIYSVCETKNSKTFAKFYDFLFDFMNIEDLKQILIFKDFQRRNLLQAALHNTEELTTHQNLWKIYRQTFRNDKEFLDMLGEVDFNGLNTFHIAGRNTSSEIFEFMIEELDKIPLRNEIRNLLSCLGDVKQNLLQTASFYLKSPKVHENLWKIYRKYFEPSEILEFIKHVNHHHNNLLFDIVVNTKDNAEMIWNEMKTFMTHDEQIEYLKTKGWLGKNLIERALDNYMHPEICEWVENIMRDYKIEKKLESTGFSKPRLGWHRLK